MSSNKPYEIKLKGNVLALAKIGIDNYTQEKIVLFEGKCDGIHYPDWQEDAHCLHDEGYCDYDIYEIRPIDDEYFYIIDSNGNKQENNKYRILEIIKVFEEDLEMEIL